MAGVVKKIYHVVAFSWYAFVIKSIYGKGNAVMPPGVTVYGGPWKYLTFLNLVLQMVFFGLAAIDDLYRRDTKVTLLNLCKDMVFAVFAFPVGTFVVLLFWAIFAYDRQLVYPASLDILFPPWLNHAMHTLVLPILLGEIVLQPHTYPRTKNGLVALGTVGLAYLSWVIWVYVTVGVWVYPLLGLFSLPGLIVFFIHNMIIITLLYLLGRTLNRRIWGCQ